MLELFSLLVLFAACLGCWSVKSAENSAITRAARPTKKITPIDSSCRYPAPRPWTCCVRLVPQQIFTLHWVHSRGFQVGPNQKKKHNFFSIIFFYAEFRCKKNKTNKNLLILHHFNQIWNPRVNSRLWFPLCACVWTCTFVCACGCVCARACVRTRALFRALLGSLDGWGACVLPFCRSGAPLCPCQWTCCLHDPRLLCAWATRSEGSKLISFL